MAAGLPLDCRRGGGTVRLISTHVQNVSLFVVDAAFVEGRPCEKVAKVCQEAVNRMSVGKLRIRSPKEAGGMPYLVFLLLSAVDEFGECTKKTPIGPTPTGN